MAFFLMAISSRSLGDLAIWISEGQQIFLQKTIYILDIHSMNATSSYPYPWLSSVIYFCIYKFMSLDFIYVLHRLIPPFIIFFWLQKFPQLLYKKNWWIILISMLGSSSMFIDRPALLAIPFVVISFHLFESNGFLKNRIWMYLILWLWVQIHGSFILYFILLGWKVLINVLIRKKYFLIKKYLKFIFCSLLISTLNPWGFKIYEYVYVTARVSSYRMTEWQPLYKIFDNLNLITIFAALFILISICLLLAKRIQKLTLFRASTLLFVMMIFGMRNISIFFATWPLAYFQRAQKIKFVNKATPLIKIVLNYSILLAILICSIFMISDKSLEIRKNLGTPSLSLYDQTVVPEVFHYLKKVDGQKNIFNDWLLGSYLTLLPDTKIFIDTRNIIYSDQIDRDYENIYKNDFKQSENVFSSKNINYILIKSNSTLAQSLQSSPNWSLVMTEGLYVLYKKN